MQCDRTISPHPSGRLQSTTTAPTFFCIKSQTVETISWLHVTDIHFGMAGQVFLWPKFKRPFFQSPVSF